MSGKSTTTKPTTTYERLSKQRTRDRRQHDSRNTRRMEAQCSRTNDLVTKRRGTSQLQTILHSITPPRSSRRRPSSDDSSTTETNSSQKDNKVKEYPENDPYPSPPPPQLDIKRLIKKTWQALPPDEVEESRLYIIYIYIL